MVKPKQTLQNELTFHGAHFENESQLLYTDDHNPLH